MHDLLGYCGNLCVGLNTGTLYYRKRPNANYLYYNIVSKVTFAKIFYCTNRQCQLNFKNVSNSAFTKTASYIVVVTPCFHYHSDYNLKMAL